jgi:anthranilate/para-aminobenzoate synthase component II
MMLNLQLIKLRVKRPMIQYHPEVFTPQTGQKMLENFSKIAEVPQNFTPNAL